MTEIPKKSQITPAHRHHPRHFLGSQLVYPVLSRRSGGISLGVNLCPNKSCNFNCIYCQVSRKDQSVGQLNSVSLEKLEQELRQLLEIITTGQLYEHPPFDKTPPILRRLNDIAISGDGEPTAFHDFASACRTIARVKNELSVPQVKIVLITNSSLLHRDDVREGLEILDKNQGQIWAKLDAGTEDFFKFVNQTSIPFLQILDNILQAAQERPIVIQTLFARVDSKRVSQQEVAAYADRLADIIDKGGQISAVQLHTVARPPRDKRVTSLTNDEIDAIAEEINARVAVKLEKYYS